MIPTSNLRTPPDSIYKYLEMALDARWITNNGSLVRLLEERLKGIHGAKHCIVMCSGFWAIALVLKTFGGGRVIMPTMTYRRLPDIAHWAGMVPDFCDIDDNLGMDIVSAEKRIRPDTKAILCAQPIVKRANMIGIEYLGHDYGIPVVFDSVEAAYGLHRGRRIGSFGVAECFSLHASKLLNGFEGGYVTTGDDELAERLKDLRCFGEGGMNAKLNEIHAAAALAALDDLNFQLQRNEIVYQCYRRFLDTVEYPQDSTHKNIMVEVENRDEVLKALHALGYLARPYYPEPFHMKQMPYETHSGECPVAERLCGRFLLLPCGDFINLADITRIADVVCRTAKFPSEAGSFRDASGDNRAPILH